jgi:5-methylthioadenosine/S-adenosylhomocysteine deaminase
MEFGMISQVDLLIRNGMVIPMDGGPKVCPATDVAIVADCIFAIGPHLNVEAKQIIDARGHAVLPGLVDAHMHETLTRGICEDLPLDRWLSEICYPLDRSYTYEIMLASAMMNQAEMIMGGITTFIDIYRYPQACAEIALKSGLRAILAPQIISDPPLVGESVESAEAFVSSWKGRSSRVLPAFGPHAPYSCTPNDLHRIADLAEKYDTPIHSHLGETSWEVGVIRERYGLTPTEYYERQGLLSPRLSVAHGVKLTPPEIKLLADRGVAIVYNPTSNMKMAAGIAPIVEFQQAKLTVALGTDSNLSNNNLDMWEEMRLGAILQKLSTNNAGALPCQTILQMATIEGARALGLADKVGSIEVGKKADIILVDLNHPHLWPIFEGKQNNLVENLVYSANAGDISHTIVDGQVLMSDRILKTLDLSEVLKEVDGAAEKLLAISGLSESNLEK